MACKSYYVENNGTSVNKTVTFTDCYTGETVIMDIPYQNGGSNPPLLYGVQRYYFSSATTPVTESGMTNLVEVGDVAPPNGFNTASFDYTKHHSIAYNKVVNPVFGTSTTGGFDYVSYYDTLTNQFTGSIRRDYHGGNFYEGDLTLLHTVSGSIIEPGFASNSMLTYISPIYSGSPVDVQRAVCVSMDNQANARSPVGVGTTASYIDCNFNTVIESWSYAQDVDVSIISSPDPSLGSTKFEDSWTVNSWGSPVTGSTIIEPCSSSLYTFSGIDERYNHNLGTKYIVANIYESGGVGIFPNSLTSTTNYVDFDFTAITDGWITVKEANYSQSFSSKISVDVSHSLNTENVIVQTFDSSNQLFIPNSVTISGSNNVIVDFGGVPLSGFVSVLSGLYSEEFTNVTESLINHNFGTKNQLIAIYESGSQIYPHSIDLINDYTTNISFSVPTTGKIVMDRVCADIPPQTEIFIGSDTVTESVSTCIPVTVGNGFENVLTWQGTIQYNSILLDFVSESNDNIGITLFEPSSGSLTFSWISPYLTGSTFSSGSTLFELCFNTTGSGLARLEFTGSPTLLEMSDQSGSIFDVTYNTGSITVLEATSSTENVTLYLYESSSEAEFFDIYYGETPTGPWYLADSGSNVNLYADYSYTLPVLSGSNYLKVVNKNPIYFPDNFKIHDLTFGEPSKGTTPAPTPEFTTQSLGGDIDLVNNTGGAISIKGLYLQTSGGFTASTDQIPPIINMNTGDTYSFSIPAVTGSNVDILEELNLVVEIAGDQTSIITGSYSDGGSAFLYPAAFYSGSTYAGGPDTTTTIFTFNTNTSVTDTSQIRAIGTATL